MTKQHEVILSNGDDDRAAKLGKYFRDYLSNWMGQTIVGMSLSGFSEKVARELALSFLEHGCAAWIASSDAAQHEDDDATAERCKRVALELFDILQREVLS